MARLTRDQRSTNAVARPTRFGVLLKQLRASAGLTQAELAERAGMSWRGIADLERGVRRSPYPATIRRLADALSLSAADRAELVALSGRTPATVNARPLRTVGIHPPLSTFIGREGDIARIQQLFTESRLLTLTGPPGVGKTRLAYEAARACMGECADGAASIELAPVENPGMVAYAIADGLGISDEPGQSINATLEEALHERQVLLVLDNCEHLLLACAALVDRLLRACPGLRMICTSRAALRVPGEVVVEVPALAASEAVRLFVERCRAHHPGFVPSDADETLVGDICARLDGLPLALELAAARVRGLGLEEVAARLDDRFRLLTGGSRTAAPHQQTLEATLDWSYGLLSDSERKVFAAASVFVGGADARALAAVCRVNAGVDVLDIASSLVEQSLISLVDDLNGRLRYGMLESVREYAQQRLSASGEDEAVRRRHADVFYKTVVGEGLPPPGAEDAEWLALLDRDHANARAALRWLIDARHVERAMRLASAVARYLDNRGYVFEGRQWLREVLAIQPPGRANAAYLEAVVTAAQLALRDDDYDAVEALVNLGLEVESQAGDPASVARLLTTQATARGFRGDFASARALHERAVTIWRQLGEPVGIATALNNLSIVCDQLGDVEAARAALLECIDLARRVAPGRTLASALNNLGLLLDRCSQYPEARPLLEESLSIARQHRDPYAIANALGSLGLVLHATGDLANARQRFEESLEVRRKAADRRGIAMSLQNLAAVLVDLHDLAQAEFLLDESLAIFSDLHSAWGVADVLETQACLAAARSDNARAQVLMAQADQTRHDLGTPRPARLQAQIDHWLKVV